jgi:xanthosine utilization system XapX-like protein
MDGNSPDTPQGKVRGDRLVSLSSIGAIIFFGEYRRSAAFRDNLRQHLLWIPLSNNQTAASLSQTFVQILKSAEKEILSPAGLRVVAGVEYQRVQDKQGNYAIAFVNGGFQSQVVVQAKIAPDPPDGILRHSGIAFQLLELKRYSTPAVPARHILGILKGSEIILTLLSFISPEDWVMSDYQSGLVPLILPVTMIKHYVRLYNVSYSAGQVYLNPRPKELALHNHV